MADKYTQDEIDALGAKGHAFHNPDGHYSYPVDDLDDLHNAIRAVGRGGASHDAIRAYIMRRARAMGHADLIPDNWTSGGQSASLDRTPFELLKRRRHSMINRPERRALPFTAGQVELRAKPSGHGTTNYEFNGYAVSYLTPFEMWDQWGDPYVENVEQRACATSAARPDLDTPFLIGHNDGGISLARTKSGTMRLSDDSHGLHVNVPELDGRSPLVQSLASAIERRDMDEMSVGFVCRKQEWTEDYAQRNISEMDIHRGDVSIVVLAANPATAGATLTVPGLEAAAARRRTEAREEAQHQEALMLNGTAKRLPIIDSCLDQAQQLFAKVDLSSLPPDVVQAINLVNSADIHVNHILKHEKLPDADGRAAGNPGLERRDDAAGEVTNADDAPDFNPGAQPGGDGTHAPMTGTHSHDHAGYGAKGHGAHSHTHVADSSHLHDHQYDSNAVIVLDDAGVVERVGGAMSDADLLSAQGPNAETLKAWLALERAAR
jgi:HK97 family phage prohead protease